VLLLLLLLVMVLLLLLLPCSYWCSPASIQIS
jgi:hypothetical protein